MRVWPRLRAGWWLGPALLTAYALSASATEPFPALRPATRAQAIQTLSGGAPLPVPCISSLVQSALSDEAATAPVRRALRALAAPTVLPGERRWTEPEGTIRYTLDRGSFDRLDPADDDHDGRPDLLQAAIDGLREGRRVLSGRLDLPVPTQVDVVLAETGSGIEGYALETPLGKVQIVLDSSPAGGAAALRAAAAHQLAHATVLSLGSVPPAWSEALATWTVLAVGGPDARTAALLSDRLRRLDEGLEAADLGLAAGNAAWLSFLDEAYGPLAVRLSFQEMGAGEPASQAFDRALRRGFSDGLAPAFREFQLWSLLVGSRSDNRHFSFASRLADPTFSASSSGLPVLTLGTEPSVAPLGAVAVLVVPDETQGGVTVRLEGEVGGAWEADLVLVSPQGALYRIPLSLDADGRGEVTVPLGHTSQAILLARNIGIDGPARRYSWSAHHEREWPYELSSLEARPEADGGVSITWETRSERQIVGFNVLRVDAGGVARLNPVWIPAMGTDGEPCSYQFLDTDPPAGTSPSYRIEAVTVDGLSSPSDPVAISPSR